MPEDTITEDEVISQDDIDKLLNASVHDEDNDGKEEDAGPAADAEDELAELSQDDIDNLLSGGPLGYDSSSSEPDGNDELSSDPGTVSETEDTDELELISQNDIDNLMNGIEAAEEPVVPETVPDTESDDNYDDDDDDEDLALFSQDDINKLISNPVVSGEKSETITTENQADLESETEDADVLELVSQDDIDKLMNQQPEDDKGMEPEIIENKNEDILNSENIISESDAVDIEACMITQETIDQLMKDDVEEDVDAVSDDVSDSEIKSDPEQIIEKDEDIEDEKGFKTSEDSDSTDIPGAISNEKDDLTELSDVEKNDLDSILEDSPDVVDGELEDGSNLISQDDIDALLQGTEEEDEDILGDIDGNLNNKHIDDDSGINIDDLENQVVIEEVEKNENGKPASTPSTDEVQSEEKEKKAKPEKKWFRSKLMLAGFGTIFLLLSIGAGYYFFFYEPALKVRLHNMKADLQANSNFKGKTKNIDANLSDFPQVIVPRGPGAIALKDFIVFSQGKNKKLTYISVDLSVHYSKAKALNEIKKHLPFYRGVIYDAIEKVILSDTKKEISAKTISKVIKQALNQVMINKYIDQVLLTSFKTG